MENLLFTEVMVTFVWLDLLSFFYIHHFAAAFESVSQHPYLSIGMVSGGGYQGLVLTWTLH